MNASITGRRRGATEGELEQGAGSSGANGQRRRVEHHHGAHAANGTPPASAPASEVEARLAQTLQSFKDMLGEALRPMSSSLDALTTKVEWLHTNCVTSAEMEERLEERIAEMEEDELAPPA